MIKKKICSNVDLITEVKAELEQKVRNVHNFTVAPFEIKNNTYCIFNIMPP